MLGLIDSFTVTFFSSVPKFKERFLVFQMIIQVSGHDYILEELFSSIKVICFAVG